MNPNGIDGPTLKKLFICKECKWLSLGNHYIKPYQCHHPDHFNKIKSGPVGDISEDLITPNYCPYLLKKFRTEKLKELNEYRRTEEKVA